MSIGFGPVIAAALLAIVALSSPLSAQSISGRLLDMHTDEPIDLGLVIMISETGDSITSALSSTTGLFEVQAAEAGNYLLLAAALGYRETRVGLFELGEGGEMSVEFRLWPEPLEIDGVMVQSLVQEPRLVRNGFYRRMQRGVGSFLSPADIAERTELQTIDLLQGLPGVRMTLNPLEGARVQLRGSRGYCVPDLMVDGVRATWEGTSARLDDLVPKEMIYAVEVHRGVSGMPIEFGSFNSCGLVVIWTVAGRR